MRSQQRKSLDRTGSQQRITTAAEKRIANEKGEITLKKMINDAALENVNGGGFLDFLRMADEDCASFDELGRRYWQAYR